MDISRIKDAALLAAATTIVGFAVKFVTLPTRVASLETGMASMDKKLDLIIGKLP